MLPKQTSISKCSFDATAFPPFHHGLLNWASTSTSLSTTDEETSGTESMENAVTVLITEFENDELQKCRNTDV